MQEEESFNSRETRASARAARCALPLVPAPLSNPWCSGDSEAPKPSRPPAAPCAPSLRLWCLLPTGLSPAPPGALRGAPGASPGPVPREPAGWRGSPTDTRGCRGVRARGEPSASCCRPGRTAGLLRLCLPQLSRKVFLVLIAALERISARFSSPWYCVF